MSSIPVAACVWGGVFVALAGAVMFGWVAAVAARVRTEFASRQGTE